MKRPERAAGGAAVAVGSPKAEVDSPRIILTGAWSSRVAGAITRRWPAERLEIRYLGPTSSKDRVRNRPYVEATLLDPDVTAIRLGEGKRFTHALWAHLWELTSRFHDTVVEPSVPAKFIGRIYSSRTAGVLYGRKFHELVQPWVFLCLFARHVVAKEPDKEASTIVYLSENPFGRWVIDYLRTIYPNVQFSEPSVLRMFRLQGGPGLRLLLGRFARGLLSPLRPSENEDGRTSSPYVAPFSVHGNPNRDRRHAIAVEACWGLEPEKRRSDLFWLPQSGLDGASHVMVYFDRADTPASDEALALVRDRGWYPEVLRRDSGTAKAAEVNSHQSSPDWWRRSLMLLSAPLWLLARSRQRRMVHWYWMRVAESLLTAATWQALFKKHNVRVHSNNTDGQSSRHLELSTALEWTGGLNIRSDTTSRYTPALRLGSRITPFDVFCVWGPQMAGIFQELDLAGITTLVTSGYPFDHLFKASLREAAKLKGQLQAAGASRIICFFDTSFSHRTDTSLEDLELIYRVILHEIVENPGLGLILKPKKRLDETAFASTELHRLLDKAVASGRCLPLFASSSSGTIYPYGPALAADLAVGYPINTAVIEAVLAGVPGVHIDLSREPGHPFYDQGYEQIVFDDLDRAMDAIRRWLRNPADAPGLGDHSNVIDSIDPFRDGKAAERIGQFMSWSMAGFERGLSRDDVVRHASRLYGEKYGFEHVRLAPRLGNL